ncbi:MAG: hypothetical protein JXR97_13980 [Planctomycetes bacterium]|nr:hypothetical protein [Planctomycetota bacterium]
MEFKLRVIKSRKKNEVRNKKDAGKIRVKVRGRKRWIDPAKKDEKK